MARSRGRSRNSSEANRPIRRLFGTSRSRSARLRFGAPQVALRVDPLADLCRFASTYAFGIAKNHPFVDGNKRVAFECAYVFPRFHGWHITATQEEVVRAMLALASGELSEDEFSVWLRDGSESAEL